jgi:hypothetical protein
MALGRPPSGRVDPTALPRPVRNLSQLRPNANGVRARPSQVSPRAETGAPIFLLAGSGQRSDQEISRKRAGCARRSVDTRLGGCILPPACGPRSIVHGGPPPSRDWRNDYRNSACSSVTPHSYPSTLYRLADRLAELTPIPVVANEARDVQHRTTHGSLTLLLRRERYCARPGKGA